MTNVTGRAARVLLVAATALTLLGFAPGAEAATRVVADARDARGAIDIRSVSHAYSGRGVVVHTLTAYAGFASSSLSGRRSVQFHFDTAGSRAPDLAVVVVWTGRRLGGVVLDARGRVVGSAAVSRPSSRSLVVKTGFFSELPGYRWYAVAAEGRTADVAPNRATILHDYTGPSAFIGDPCHRDFCSPVPESTTFPLAFTVRDRGGSGVAAWTLEQRPFGGSGWSTVLRGAGDGRKTASVTGAEGISYEFRVVARDRAGTTVVGPAHVVSVPLDDSNPALVPGYAGAWTGGVPSAGAFMGSVRRTSDTTTPASLTYSFTGRYVALVTAGGGGWGNVLIDGVPQEFFGGTSSGDPAARWIAFEKDLPPGPHTVTFRVHGDVDFDGLVIR